jgi:hypothetical protein
LYFLELGPVDACKLVRDRATGESLCYGFVDYPDHFTAALAKQLLTGRIVFDTELKLR